MVTQILSNSWRLVWDEKRLMLIPLVGGIIALIIGCFAIVALGVELADNLGEFDFENIDSWTQEDLDRLGEVLSDDSQSSQWIMSFVQGVFVFFFQFATLTAVFRALAQQPYDVGSVLGETWSRIGRIVVFALILVLLGIVVGAVTALLANIITGALAGLLSLALWVAYLVATFFLLPIAVAEDTDPIPAVARSWELGRSVATTLIGGGILFFILMIAYAIGLTITMGILLLILAAIARALVVLWLLAVVVAFAVYGLSAQVMFAAFQAQLYQHAAAQLDGESPFTPESTSSTTSTRTPSTSRSPERWCRIPI